MKESVTKSKYYRPYDKDKCDKVEGKKFPFTLIPIKSETHFWKNSCEIPYPGDGKPANPGADGPPAGSDGAPTDDNGGKDAAGGETGWEDARKDEKKKNEAKEEAKTGGGPNDPPCKTTKPFDIEFWKYQNMMRTNP